MNDFDLSKDEDEHKQFNDRSFYINREQSKDIIDCSSVFSYDQVNEQKEILQRKIQGDQHNTIDIESRDQGISFHIQITKQTYRIECCFQCAATVNDNRTYQAAPSCALALEFSSTHQSQMTLITSFIHSSSKRRHFKI